VRRGGTSGFFLRFNAPPTRKGGAGFYGIGFVIGHWLVGAVEFSGMVAFTTFFAASPLLSLGSGGLAVFAG
jgi:hypothetical protein